MPQSLSLAQVFQQIKVLAFMEGGKSGPSQLSKPQPTWPCPNPSLVLMNQGLSRNMWIVPIFIAQLGGPEKKISRNLRLHSQNCVRFYAFYCFAIESFQFCLLKAGLTLASLQGFGQHLTTEEELEQKSSAKEMKTFFFFFNSIF